MAPLILNLSQQSALTQALLAVCFLQSLHALRLHTPPNWSFSTDLSSSAAASSSSPSSIVDAYSVADSLTLFVPVLSTSNFTSGRKGFSLGFLSLFDTPGSPATRIFLTVCLGSSRTQLHGEQPFAVPVWNYNTNRPMRQLEHGFVSLNVNSNRELLLKDGDGTIVWNVSDVDAIDMQDNGNLVIFTPNNGVAWQSFDHPGDTLLQGQSLTLGMKLVSNNSVYLALMEPGGLLFYMNSPSSVPLEYDIASSNKSVSDFMGSQKPFLLSKSPSVNMTASLEIPACPREANNNSNSGSLPYAKLEDDHLRVQGRCSDMNYSFGRADFIRLDNDGNLRDYTFMEESLMSIRENQRSCIPPLVCGAYGLCNQFLLSNYTQHTCRCPSGADIENLASNAFKFVDPADPSQGCQREIPLQCGQDTSSQYMVEMSSTTVISMPYLFETTWANNTFPLQECLSNCASTCSCTGVFYHHNTSFCLPFGDGTLLSANFSFLSVPFPQYSAYIKMQVAPASATSSHIKQILPPVVICSSLIALVGAFLVAKKCQCWGFKKSPEVDTEEEQLQSALPMLPTRFSFEDLERFTNGFSKLVGSGGFGSVYEGLLPDGRKVGVKKLDHLSQGKKQFLTEVATIGGISHFNIVRLYGFCLQGSNRLLIYEFMENGSLDQWIFPNNKSPDNLLDWGTRFHVAVGTARGLAYLHEELPQPILHLDIKPQNILLNEDFNPKLGDFGLSKLIKRGTASSSSSSVTATIRGTPGYIAPEWASHSMVSKKCDVYSLGMVLLELVGGRKNVDVSLMGSDEFDFPTWVALNWKEGKTIELLDKRLQRGPINEKEVQRVIEVALLCIQQDPSLRPSMRIVCQLLEGSMDAADIVDNMKLEVSPPVSVSGSLQSSLYQFNSEGR